MDEELLRLTHETDADEYRAAARWWLKLKECGPDSPALSEFTAWLEQSPARQRAFAQVEATWLNLELALVGYSAVDAQQTTAMHSVRERAK